MYVYGAEVLLALLFVHIRLTKPEWFHGFFEQFWPLIVLGIAFVGVAIGEWFRRRRLMVLGQPLATPGALLPLLPVLGFWILPTRVDYSLLMLAVGLLYSGLAVTRRSFGFGLLAIAATNGSLWYFLFEHHAGYRFTGASAVVDDPAGPVRAPRGMHLNRRQLSATRGSERDDSLWHVDRDLRFLDRRHFLARRGPCALASVGAGRVVARGNSDGNVYTASPGVSDSRHVVSRAVLVDDHLVRRGRFAATWLWSGDGIADWC